MKTPADFRRWCRAGVAGLVAMAWCVAAQAAATAEQVQQALQRSVEAVRGAREAIDPAEFSVPDCAKQWGGNVGATFAFVRDAIAYEPYGGALRGAAGCLRAKAGNATDKALLLAELLRAEGYTTRFAFGTLPEKARDVLCDQYLREELDEAPTVALPYASAVPQLAAARAQAAQDFERRLLGREQTLSAAIGRALGDAAQPAAGGVSLAALRPLLAAHVWVQVERNGAYVDLDPAFRTAKPGSTFAPIERTGETLAPDAWHAVALTAFVERYDGQKVNEEPLFTVAYHTADLAARPVAVSVTGAAAGPGGLGGALGGAFGASPKQTVACDVDGVAVKTATISAAPPSKAGGGGFLDFGGGSASPNGPFIVAVGFRVDFTGPGERRAPIRRYFMDLWGEARRAAHDAAALATLPVDRAALAGLDAQTFYLALETGPINPAMAQAHLLDQTLAAARGIAVANNAVSYAPSADSDPGHGFGEDYFLYFDALSTALCGRHPFDPGARLVLVDCVGTSSVRFDVTSDPQWVVTETTRQPRRMQGDLGILASVIEEEVIDGTGDADTPAATTNVGSARVLGDALARGALVVAANATALPADISADAGRRMHDALAAGRLIVLPHDGAAGCWYEYDAATGRLEATCESGLHEAATERAELEKDDAKKARLASRWRRVVRKIADCATENIQTIVNLIVHARTTGVTYADAFDSLAAAKDCVDQIREAHAIANARRNAVDKAWKQEKELVEKTDKGTRNWNEKELEELKKTGRVSGYDGHHINNVHDHPEMAGDPNNIKFLTRDEHYDAHDGDWTNATKGDLIDRSLP